MTTNFNNIRILVDDPIPVSDAQFIPFLTPEASQCNTDPDFYYDPTTQTLNVPNFSINDLLIAGDIQFTNTVNHLIFVAASAATVDGFDLSVVAGDGGAASALAVGGDGGDGTLLGGDGGAGSAAQDAGDGGPANVLGGNGGDGTATSVAGAGGDLVLRSGSGGVDGGGGGGDAGSIDLDTGTPTSAFVSNQVGIGNVNAEAVIIGRAGKGTSVLGTFAVAQASRVIGQTEFDAGFKAHDAAKVFGDSPYVLAVTDFIVLWNTAGGNCAQTLPALAGVREQMFFISKVTGDANTVTITPNGAETIATAANLVLNTISTVQLYAPAAGTDWIVL